MTKAAQAKLWGLYQHGDGSYRSYPSSGSVFIPYAASPYQPEIIYPRPAGTGPTGINSNNALFRAYPGITYERPIATFGGAWPITYQLSNAPTGMSIVSYTARSGGTFYKIVWTNPTASASGIVLTATDALGQQDQVTFSVTVATTGFYFVDPVGGSDANPGTLASKAATLAWVYNNTNPDDIVYFMTGTVDMTGIPTTSDLGSTVGEAKTSWNAASGQFLAYPGESPTLDFGYDGTGYPYGDANDRPRIRFDAGNTNVVVMGLAITRPMVMGFQVAINPPNPAIFWDNDFSGSGYAIEGGNSAYIMWVRTSSDTYGDLIQNCSFDSSDPPYPPGSLNRGQEATKHYEQQKLLIEGNYFPPANPGDANIAIKAGITDFCIRANYGVDHVTGLMIGGNMARSNTPGHPLSVCTGEICFNRFLGDGTSDSPNPDVAGGFYTGFIQIKNFAGVPTGEIWTYRNTGRGVWNLRDITVVGEGPFHFDENVIINAQAAETPYAHFKTSNVSETSTIDMGTNIVGSVADGIIDANGGLTSPAQLGQFGYQWEV